MKNSHTSREMRWKPAEWSYQQCGSGGESNLMRTCEDLMEEVVIRLRCFSLSGGSSCSLMAQGMSQGFPGSPAFPHWPPCMHTHTHTCTSTHMHTLQARHSPCLSAVPGLQYPLSLLQLSPSVSSWPRPWPPINLTTPDTLTLTSEHDP